MPHPSFAPGFRLSMLDVVVLLAGSVGAVVLGGWLGFVVGFVVGHFFLFCNVVRMARPLELAWAAVFVVLAGATAATEHPGWLATASVSLLVTLAVVMVEVRKPSYHGVGWRRINPGLPAWWEAHVAPQRGEPASPGCLPPD